uniref:Ig-like domain-containing protein n=1 Tax=Anolis carolinensis TaxID=28377 RepID=A0A803TQL4_ANOCA|eukprot:XP_008103704.1 PREDICTED: antigen-presenting glycoprotein CD1d isoform X1 [Anolis carolinensis]
MRMACRYFLIVFFYGIGAAFFHLPAVLWPFRMLQTISFQNTSATEIMGTIAFLGDVETHSLDTHTWKIKFLQPWTQSAFTPLKWEMLGQLFRASFIDFKKAINNMVAASNYSYPFVIQSFFFCEIGTDGTKRGFYKGAANGDDVLGYSTDNATWVVQKDTPLAVAVQDFLNRNKGTTANMRSLLLNECIDILESSLKTGNETLHRQEKPVAVVFAQEPPATTDSLLLVCQVTGFYPHLINVSWLQDEVALPSSRINSTTILHNYDLTYQIRSSLAIKSMETSHSYVCRIQHSSLDGKSLVILWERKHRYRVTIVVVVLVASILVVVAGVLFYLQKKRRQYEDVNQAISKTARQ